MKLKLSKLDVIRLETGMSQLRMTEVLSQSVERDIFETICQNLAFVHLKLATHANFEKSDIDLRRLSSLILEAVRDIRNIPQKIYSGRSIENASALKEILDLTNEVLNLGIRTISLNGDFSQCNSLDFQLVYLNLHTVLVALETQRSIVSIVVEGTAKGMRCRVGYKGSQMNLGRLRKKYKTPHISPTLRNSKTIRLLGSHRYPGKTYNSLKTINLYIPLNF